MNHALEDQLAEDDEGLRATVLEVRVRLCESAIRMAILAATLERIASLPASELGAGPALARGALALSLGR